jgi:hypothetical protein
MADTLRRRRQGVRFDDGDEDYDAVKQGSDGSDDDNVKRRPAPAKVFAARKSLGYASSDDEDTTPAPPAPKWAERVVAVVDAVVVAAAPYADKALTLAEDAVVVAAPVARRAYGVATARVTREGLLIVTGLFVCLFGGSFVRLIAVAEALHVTGAYATAAAALAELREHVEVVAEAEKTDGRRKSMAVLRKERQYKRIASRKISVYASAIRNPAALTASLASLWSAAATVAAALRITFARTLVLGVSVAATVSPAMRRDFAPAVAATLKPMHRQWAPTIIDVCVRAVCVAIAWRLQRVFSAWHSAARGGVACAKALGRVLKRKGWVPARVALASDEEPYRGTDSTGPIVGGLYADEVVGFVLAACGLRLQLSRSFGLPLLLRLVLLPALALEGVLALLFLGLGP